jgi:hypothetical protein
VHVREARGGALLLRARAARLAALRLVEEPLLVVEILLSNGPDEGLATLAAP